MTSSRDTFPDILRGFALLGIAMVNVQYFAVDTVSGFESADLAGSANSACLYCDGALGDNVCVLDSLAC